MISKNRGVICCLIAAFCIGLGNVFGRLVAIDLDPLLLSTLITLLSAIFCWLLVVLYPKIKIVIPLKFAGWYFLLGAFHTAAVFLTIWGLKYTSVMNVNFLLRIEVIFAIILGFFLFKERIKKLQIFGVLLAFLGTYVFVTSFKMHIRSADIFLLIAPIFWASTWALSKKLLNKGLDSSVLATIRFTISGLIFIIVLFLISPKVPTFSLAHLPNIFLYAFLIGFLNFTLFTLALKYLQLWQATFINHFSGVIFGAFFAWLMLGETLALIKWLGGAIIIVGTSLVILAGYKRNLSKKNTCPLR